MATNKNRRLQELRGSDFEMAKGQPDIRGWEVRDSNGRKIGKVQELIFDSRAQKVRYIVVNVLDSKELELEKRTVMVPIGLAVLQPKDDDVILKNVTPFQLRALPRYNKDDLGTKAERDISTVFGRSDVKVDTSDADLDDNFYNHDHFKEDDTYRTDREKRDTTISSTSSTDTTGSERRSANEDYLRREKEANLSATDSSVNSNDLRTDSDLTDREETDEEYQRRTGKSRRIM
ncbi:MAG TPA: PRC-barrel domain-containing protein [Chitinophagaceae bacterium]|nr:PRC-barrel domain-containing protein [Chitinophagaceae bacterium]